MPNTKKFLDQTGTGYLWTKITTQLNLKAAAADLATLAGRVDTLEAAGYDDTEVRGLISDNADDISTLSGYISDISDTMDTLVGQDDNKSIRTIANEELAAQLIPANAQASLDTLQEIADWIQAHPADVTAINTAITALQNKLELAVDPSTSAQYTTVKAYVEAAIADLEAAQHTHSNKSVLDGITSTKVSNWDTAYTNNHTHSNKSVLDGITANNVAAWNAAEQNAKNYADGLASNYDAAGAADAVYSAIVAMSSAEIDSAIAGASGTTGS